MDLIIPILIDPDGLLNGMEWNGMEWTPGQFEWNGMNGMK